jgi:predicted RNase H-like HicB family nuclease
MSKYSMNLIWSEEDNAYIVTVPEFPNLSAFGKTPQQAVNEAEIAIRGFIEVLTQDGCEIPKPMTLNKAA